MLSDAPNVLRLCWCSHLEMEHQWKASLPNGACNKCCCGHFTVGGQILTKGESGG